jgi:hypothetical protein
MVGGDSLSVIYLLDRSDAISQDQLLWVALALLPLEIAIRRVPLDAAALAAQVSNWMICRYRALRSLGPSYV